MGMDSDDKLPASDDAIVLESDAQDGDASA